MNVSKFLYLAGLDFGIQWVLGAVAVALKTEKFYDLAGSFNFLIKDYYIITLI